MKISRSAFTGDNLVSWSSMVCSSKSQTLGEICQESMEINTCEVVCCVCLNIRRVYIIEPELHKKEWSNLTLKRRGKTKMGAEGYWAFAVGYDADAEDDEDKVI